MALLGNPTPEREQVAFRKGGTVDAGHAALWVLLVPLLTRFADNLRHIQRGNIPLLSLFPAFQNLTALIRLPIIQGIQGMAHDVIRRRVKVCVQLLLDAGGNFRGK
jgi:hypothetical protein